MKSIHVMIVFGMLVLGMSACGSKEPFECAADTQCVRGGSSGVCAPGGYCAFADTECESGYRYDSGAGGGVAGTCVAGSPDAGIDAPPIACGEVGLACCANDTCSDGTCTDGTCRSCVADVAFGRRFGCVVKTDGSVWCSGENGDGQLGFGLAGITVATPMQVRDLTTALVTDATGIGLGREHACAIRENGTVWCWGDNDSGQLGTNSSEPFVAAAGQVIKVDDTPLTGIVEVKAGYDHVCGRNEAGEIYCWGAGQALGSGTTTGRTRADRVVLADMTPFVGAIELYAGGVYNCARKANDELWCWGANGDGQLGDGTKTARLNPILVGMAKGVATSLWYHCHVELDSSISCAGWNRGAAFGTGEGEGFEGADHPMPVKVLETVGGAPFMGAAKLAAGSGTCALMQDTSVYCWGDGQYGQNGTGGPLRVPAPVELADGTPLTGVDRLVAKWPHVCAHVMASGAWLCWGRNSEGEFGDGAFINRPTPAPLKVSCP